jgi:hypothetical protein
MLLKYNMMELCYLSKSFCFCVNSVIAQFILKINYRLRNLMVLGFFLESELNKQKIFLETCVSYSYHNYV